LVILCLALWQAQAQVPTFTSLHTAGGTRINSGNGLAIDSAGNSYVAGSFGSQLFGGSIDLTTTNLVTTGETDGFVAKFNPQGQCLWARQFAGTNSNDAYDVIVRSDGSVLVAGEFVGTNRIGNTNLISHGGYDIFLAAFNSAGDLLWAQAIGGSGDDFAIALAPAANGSAIFTGSFIGIINLGGGISFGSADDDALLIKLNAAGAVQWARTAGGSGFQIGSDIKVDAEGNVYWAGEFETNVVFGTTTFASPDLNVFLAKYDSAGNGISARKLGVGDFAELPRIALGSDGGFFCSAAYSGDYTIDGRVLPFGREDVLVASFDSADSLRWVNAFGGPQLETCTDILVDPYGAAYLIGHYNGTLIVGNTNLASSGSLDIFIVRCSSDGQFQGATKAGGLGEDQAFAGVMTPAGDIQLTGYFSGTAQFGSLSATSPDGLHKMFLATALPAPTLRITSFPTHVTVSWPGRYANYRLQGSFDLTSWSPLAATFVNGEWVFSQQPSPSPQFFRLRSN